jgi:hypothetical protein
VLQDLDLEAGGEPEDEESAGEEHHPALRDVGHSFYLLLMKLCGLLAVSLYSEHVCIGQSLVFQVAPVS